MWDSITGPRGLYVGPYNGSGRVMWDNITGPWGSYVGQYNGTMGELCGTV